MFHLQASTLTRRPMFTPLALRAREVFLPPFISDVAPTGACFPLQVKYHIDLTYHYYSWRSPLPTCTDSIELRYKAEKAARRAARHAARQPAPVMASPQPEPAPVAIASPAPVLTPKPAPKLHPVFNRNQSAFLAQMHPKLLQPRSSPTLPAPASAVHWSTVRPLFTLAPSSEPQALAATWATTVPTVNAPAAGAPPPHSSLPPKMSRMKSKLSGEKNWVKRKSMPLPAAETPGNTGLGVVVCHIDISCFSFDRTCTSHFDGPRRACAYRQLAAILGRRKRLHAACSCAPPWFVTCTPSLMLCHSHDL